MITTNISVVETSGKRPLLLGDYQAFLTFGWFLTASGSTILSEPVFCTQKCCRSFKVYMLTLFGLGLGWGGEGGSAHADFGR